MLTRLFLVRHGEVEAAWHGRFYGAKDVPLSAAGEEQARRVAARLPRTPDRPLDAVLSSGLSRAAFGARVIAQPRGLAPEVDGDLRELERGRWTGRTRAELEAETPGACDAWFRAPAHVRPPEGESLTDLAARVLPRLGHWSSVHPGGALAIVAHLWVLRVAVCHALGLDLNQAQRLALPTGGLVVIDWPARTDAAQASRPTLVGFATDEPPSGTHWFRGPHRGTEPSPP